MLLVLVRMLGAGYADATRQYAANCLMYLANGTTASSQGMIAATPGALGALSKVISSSKCDELTKQSAVGALKHLACKNTAVQHLMCGRADVVAAVAGVLQNGSACGSALLKRVLDVMLIWSETSDGRKVLRAVAGLQAALVLASNSEDGIVSSSASQLAAKLSQVIEGGKRRRA
jgi:hypothetical protein